MSGGRVNVAAPPPASPLSLPFDVLGLILARVALRPRLIVIARVCRHFRAAVYHLLTSTEPYSLPYNFAGSLDVYPNLNALRVGSNIPSQISPERRARVTSVRYSSASADGIVDAKLTALTSLTMRVDEAAAIEVPQMLRQNSASLTHLDLTTSGGWKQFAVIKSLPGLRALTSAGVDSDLDLPFLRATSQLTRLKMRELCVRRPAKEPLLDMPELRSLHIANLDLGPVQIKWLVSLTSLTTLKVKRLKASRDLYVAFLRWAERTLVSLPFCYPEDFSACTQVTRLHCGNCSDANELLSLKPIAHQIRSVTAEAVAPQHDFITTHCSAVTRLALCKPRPGYSVRRREEPVPSVPLDLWRLPLLRELHSDKQALPWVTLALHHLPFLERLSLEYVDIELRGAVCCLVNAQSLCEPRVRIPPAWFVFCFCVSFLLRDRYYSQLAGRRPAGMTPTEADAFSAAVRAADKRGMESISFRYSSTERYLDRFDLNALRLSLQWLALRVPRYY